jgi:hypothetical protein
VATTTSTRQIHTPGISLTADIARPEPAQGLVLFAHGSGSSRHSPRNRAVAAELQRAGPATVLVDVLTPAEEELDAHTGHLQFDIDACSVATSGKGKGHLNGRGSSSRCGRTEA